MTNTNIATLEPTNVQETKENLTKGFNSVALITSYCMALKHLHLNKVEGSKGTWLEPFLEKLNVAKTHADTWLDHLGPAISVEVPQSIVDYTNTFSPAIDEILNIVNHIEGSTMTSEEKENINALTQAILNEVQEKLGIVQNLHDQLINFSKDLHGDHDHLLAGEHSAEKESSLAEVEKIKINAQIAQIKAMFQEHSTMATVSGIGIGVGLFIAAVGLCFIAAATAGVGVAPVVTLAFGLVASGAGVAGSVVYHGKIKEATEQLNTQLQALNDTERQILALKGITDNIVDIVKQNEGATKALSNVIMTWTALEGKLKSVVKHLNEAEAPDLKKVIESLRLKSAINAWEDLHDFAQGMLKSHANTVYEKDGKLIVSKVS